MGLRGTKSMLDSHPQKAKILKELLDPMITDKKMAERYSVAVGTIQKWKARTKHLMHLSRENATESTRDELMKDVAELHQENREMLRIAKRKQDVKGGAAVLQAMIGTLRLKGEATGVLGSANQAGPSPGVNINMLVGMPHTGPLREGGDDGDSGPLIDIVSEKASDDYYA